MPAAGFGRLYDYLPFPYHFDFKMSSHLGIDSQMLSRERKKMHYTHNFTEILSEYSEKAKVARTRTRFLKRPVYFVFGFALFVFFLIWVDGDESSTSPSTQPSSQDMKIAMVTFTTQETSYTHLGLKNKYSQSLRLGCGDTLIQLFSVCS